MSPGEVKARQSTLQQGTNRAAERLEQAGRKSALVSPRAQRAMADARRKVEAATKETASGSGQAAASMQEAAAALNQAAAAMVRDRERANSASSASGLPELLQRMQEAAQQQGQINQSAAGLPMGRPGGAGPSGVSPGSLARQQRKVAQGLEEVGDADATGRTDALAKEAREIAQALERGRVVEVVAARDHEVRLQPDDRLDVHRGEARHVGQVDGFGRIVVEVGSRNHASAGAEREQRLGHGRCQRHDALRPLLKRHARALVVRQLDRERGGRGGAR